jgi:hypothetical protein
MDVRSPKEPGIHAPRMRIYAALQGYFAKMIAFGTPAGV